jgi:hypothetical protein
MFFCSNKSWIPLPNFLCLHTWRAMCNTWGYTNRNWLFLSSKECCNNWELVGWSSYTKAFQPLIAWKQFKLWILLHFIWWRLHLFYLFCVVLFYLMFHVKCFLKNQLFLNKCINYELQYLKIPRIYMKAWQIQLCLQKVSL